MKHTWKKLFAAFLAVMLLVSCLSLAAFADDQVDKGETNTITVDGKTYYTASNGHSYELYQIFTGDYNSETLSNLKWGASGKIVTDHTGHTEDTANKDYSKTVCPTVINALKATDSKSDSEKLAVIKQYVDFDKPYKDATKEGSQPVASSSSEGNNAFKYTGLDAGYYLIKDTEGTQDGTGGLYTLYVVKVSGGTLLFEPKGSVPTIEKKVKTEEGNWDSANSASMGETVEYKLTANVSSRIADYGQYYLKINDTLSKGLTATDKDLNAKVVMVTPVTTVDKDSGSSSTVTYYYDITDYVYAKVGTTDATKGTTPVVFAIQDLLALKKATDIKYTDDMGDTLKGTVASTININENTSIIVTYNAKLNENAVVVDPNKNTVTLDYYNDPNNSGEGSKNPPDKPGDSEDPKEPTPTYPHGETVESTTETYTTSLSITKENDSGKVLTGAEFTLSGDNVSVLVITSTEFKEDANGTYWKLTSGLYTTTDPATVTDTKDYASTTTKYTKTTSTTTKTKGTTSNTISAEVDANGLVTFTGLGEGQYTLSETKTPGGYNTMDPITFKIEFNESTKVFSANRDDITASSDGKTLSVIILNHAGGTLPHTGGIGTTIFYVVGSIMLLGAGILFITKKRMGRESD
jgi:fimbrial isopeptide formation D2 family protein/LPXTG-motif cell wall-anchored protein